MAQNSANTAIIRTGSVWVGAQGSITAPTSHTSALDADLHELGYIDSDGVTEKYDVNTESVVAFQNGDTIDESVTEAKATFEATFLEIGNPFLAELFYADPVDDTDGSQLVSPGATPTRRAVVLNFISGDKAIRIWAPEAQFTKNGDVVYKNGQPAGFPMKITAYPSASLPKDDGTSASFKRWSSQLVVAP